MLLEVPVRILFISQDAGGAIANGGEGSAATITGSNFKGNTAGNNGNYISLSRW